MTHESKESTYLKALLRGDESLPSDVDLSQERLLELATRHQVAALAWWCLRQRRSERGASRAKEIVGFKRAYQHHRVRNESIRKDLRDLASALLERGVPAIVTKGPWLAFHAYPDPGVRPVGDIDLCISEGDYAEACSALATLGYRALGGLPVDGGAALRRAHYREQIRFVARGRRPLELHFRLINVGLVRKREDWLWSTSRPLCAEFHPLQCPGPEAMLVHLLLHANQHGFAPLRLLFDIRFELEADRSRLDAQIFHEIGRDLRIEASHFHTLDLAMRMTGADPSPLDLNAMRPTALRRAIFRRAWRLDQVETLERSPRESAFEAPRLYLLEMGSLWDKIEYLFHLLCAAPAGLLITRWRARRHRSRRSRSARIPGWSR